MIKWVQSSQLYRKPYFRVEFKEANFLNIMLDLQNRVVVNTNFMTLKLTLNYNLGN